jgi:hypothetical protein
MARLSAGHARSRTQIIPICVIGADSDEIGEAMQNGGSVRARCDGLRYGPESFGAHY